MAQPETWDFLKCNQKEYCLSANVLNINIIIENSLQKLISTLTQCEKNFNSLQCLLFKLNGSLGDITEPRKCIRHMDKPTQSLDHPRVIDWMQAYPWAKCWFLWSAYNPYFSLMFRWTVVTLEYSSETS
jgi:hypothetical protein